MARFAHLLRTANQTHDFTIFLLIGILLIFTRSTSRPEPRRQVGRSTSRPARNRYEYVWAGLRLLGDTLYVGVSSYCDQPGPDDLAAEGRLVAIDVQSGAEIARCDPVPGFGNLGGIWGGGGVSISPDGSGLFAGIGNAYVYDPSCNCHLETVGYRNSMVRLTPSLEPVASNRPQEVEDTPPGADIDFGGRRPFSSSPETWTETPVRSASYRMCPVGPAHFEPSRAR